MSTPTNVSLLEEMKAKSVRRESWSKNNHYRAPSGFWGDAEWYDLQLERRLPEVVPMLKEVVYALPPLGAGKVCDVCAGSGRASEAIRAAYPRATLTLVDADGGRLEMARRRVAPPCEFVKCPLGSDAPTLPDAPFDAVVLVLALRHVTCPAPHYAELHDLTPVSGEEQIYAAYQAFLGQVFCSLQPGGTVIIGDHVEHGHPSVFAHCKLLEDAGFTDVDVSWRNKDYFVCGARVPMDDEEPPWHQGMNSAGDVRSRWRDNKSEDGIELAETATAADPTVVPIEPTSIELEETAGGTEMRSLSSDETPSDAVAGLRSLLTGGRH